MTVYGEMVHCISKLKNTLTVSFASHLHSTHICVHYKVDKIVEFQAFIKYVLPTYLGHVIFFFKNDPEIP